MQFSEELAALIKRAEGATAAAHRLFDENDRWRQSVVRQFDYMFEIGAEFRRPPLSWTQAAPDRLAAEDR
ncbi:hypothetical protein [Bradyrhizobium sp. UFLA05-112]